MLKTVSFRLVVAGYLFASLTVIRAESITQNFSGNPLTNGWAHFGDSSMFSWDATNQDLVITWDSTHPNSYFHHPLGTTITRYDDFRIEFDLNLSDCISGNEPGKTGPLQIGLGFLNHAGATATNFQRGVYGNAPNVVEFNYFPYGYFTFGPDIFPSDPTTVADFVSSGGFSYTPTYFDPYYEFQLPTNQWVHVTLNFTAGNQSLSLTLTTNNAVLYHPADVVLNNPGNSAFTAADNYYVDTFSISSYSSQGDDYNSVLGHGRVDNISVTIPVVQDFTGALSNGTWVAQFRGRTNWNYTLERTTDFIGWSNVSGTLPGTGTNLSLSDVTPPPGSAFYRVRAERL